VLLELARSDKSDLEKALQKILSQSAATLEVRALVIGHWQENNSAIACESSICATREAVMSSSKVRGWGFF